MTLFIADLRATWAEVDPAGWTFALRLDVGHLLRQLRCVLFHRRRIQRRPAANSAWALSQCRRCGTYWWLRGD